MARDHALRPLPLNSFSPLYAASIRARFTRVNLAGVATAAAPVRPPPPDEIAHRLAPLCRAHGITRLEVFGSVARGDAQPGSDVNLIATLSKPLGFRFYGLADDMEGEFGVEVDLLTRHHVDTMTNPYYKTSILRDARVIFDA